MSQQRRQVQDIVDEGPLHKYYTAIPNTVVRGTKSHGISIYAKWLYVYLKSVTGDGGTCFRSTTTIAQECGISRGQVSAAKKELVKQKLIAIQKGKNPKRDADQIRIKDIWVANMQEFCVHNMNSLHEDEDQENTELIHVSVHNTNTDTGQSSQYEHQAASEFTIRTQSSQYEHQSSQYELKKIPLRRSHEEEEKERDSLTTFESLHDAGSADASATVPAVACPDETALATQVPKPTKLVITPLAAEDWLALLLTTYADTMNVAALNDDAWWIDVSQPLEAVFGEPWLNREFSKISAYLREKPAKRPASASGWKRFVRTWLHRSYEHDRRYNTHGTQARRRS